MPTEVAQQQKPFVDLHTAIDLQNGTLKKQPNMYMDRRSVLGHPINHKRKGKEPPPRAQHPLEIQNTLHVPNVLEFTSNKLPEIEMTTAGGLAAYAEQRFRKMTDVIQHISEPGGGNRLQTILAEGQTHLSGRAIGTNASQKTHEQLLLNMFTEQTTTSRGIEYTWSKEKFDEAKNDPKVLAIVEAIAIRDAADIFRACGYRASIDPRGTRTNAQDALQHVDLYGQGLIRKIGHGFRDVMNRPITQGGRDTDRTIAGRIAQAFTGIAAPAIAGGAIGARLGNPALGAAAGAIAGAATEGFIALNNAGVRLRIERVSPAEFITAQNTQSLAVSELWGVNAKDFEFVDGQIRLTDVASRNTRSKNLDNAFSTAFEAIATHVKYMEDLGVDTRKVELPDQWLRDDMLDIPRTSASETGVHIYDQIYDRFHQLGGRNPANLFETTLRWTQAETEVLTEKVQRIVDKERESTDPYHTERFKEIKAAWEGTGGLPRPEVVAKQNLEKDQALLKEDAEKVKEYKKKFKPPVQGEAPEEGSARERYDQLVESAQQLLPDVIDTTTNLPFESIQAALDQISKVLSKDVGTPEFPEIPEFSINVGGVVTILHPVEAAKPAVPGTNTTEKIAINIDGTSVEIKNFEAQLRSALTKRDHAIKVAKSHAITATNRLGEPFVRNQDEIAQDIELAKEEFKRREIEINEERTQLDTLRKKLSEAQNAIETERKSWSRTNDRENVRIQMRKDFNDVRDIVRLTGRTIPPVLPMQVILNEINRAHELYPERGLGWPAEDNNNEKNRAIVLHAMVHARVQERIDRAPLLTSDAYRAFTLRTGVLQRARITNEQLLVLTPEEIANIIRDENTKQAFLTSAGTPLILIAGAPPVMQIMDRLGTWQNASAFIADAQDMARQSLEFQQEEINRLNGTVGRDLRTQNETILNRNAQVDFAIAITENPHIIFDRGLKPFQSVNPVDLQYFTLQPGSEAAANVWRGVAKHDMPYSDAEFAAGIPANVLEVIDMVTGYQEMSNTDILRNPQQTTAMDRGTAFLGAMSNLRALVGDSITPPITDARLVATFSEAFCPGLPRYVNPTTFQQLGDEMRARAANNEYGMDDVQRALHRLVALLSLRGQRALTRP